MDEISGRRFNRSEPSQSLMLLKPTQGVPHEGGFLFDEESRYYKVLEQWIAEGCNYKADAARVEKIEIYPPTPLLQRRGDQQQLIVYATYSDGTTRDVTRESVFETSNFEVATVSKQGLISAVRRGEALLLFVSKATTQLPRFPSSATATVISGRQPKSTTTSMLW